MKGYPAYLQKKGKGRIMINIEDNDSHYVFVCEFKRKRFSRTEFGYYIDEEIIIDKGGNEVKEVYQISSMPHLGCFHLPK